MKTKRTLIILTILVAVFSLLTMSLAAASDGELDCEALANSPLAEPAGYAEQCLDGVDVNPWSVDSVDPTDTAFALDIGFVSDNFVSHVLNNFPGQTVLGPNAQPIFAMDFDETATTLYAIDNTSRQLGTINLANGAFSAIAAVSGIPGGDNISGLTIDPSSGTAYVSGLGSSGMTLYTLNLGTAVATPIGSDAGVPLLIDISMNCEGQMYGHDIGTDMIYTINPSTGAAVAVGGTGVNSNFAQGMDFDNADGTLYAYTYQGGGANQYGTINLGTGALTPLATSNPQGEFEGATQTTCPPPPAPDFTFEKTVGLGPGCAVTDTVNIPAGMGGTEVTYCYSIDNTGNVTHELHYVVDDQLGVLVGPAFPFVVPPGTGAFFTVTELITETTVNVASWSVSDVQGSYALTATDTATVTQDAPTSVSLSGFGSDQVTFTPVWLLALLAVLGGFGLAIRRKLTA